LIERPGTGCRPDGIACSKVQAHLTPQLPFTKAV
jgi:hypothetical protein